MSTVSTIARGGLIAIAWAALGSASAVAASPDSKPADHARNCFFITLPLALRGNGSRVRVIVSGTL